jgi:hypothetical protein
MLALGLLTFAGFTLTMPSLTHAAFMNHADAPALGFAVLSCACLVRAAKPRRRAMMLVLAALCAVLSAASKQNMMLVLVLLPIYVLLRYGWRWMGIFAATEIVLAGIGTAAAVFGFGAGPLLYSMFTIPSRHPWWLESHGRLTSLLMASGYLIVDAAGPAIAMGVALLFDAARRPTGRRSLRVWIMRNPWALPLALAILMIPFSLVGRVKQGGWANALSPTTCFLVLALAAWIVRYRPRAGESWAQPLHRVAVGASALLCGALGILAVNPWHQSLQSWQDVLDFKHNPEQVAYGFGLEHPNAAYLPWNPLVTLMTDGRYYLFEYGVIDLRFAGEAMGQQRMNQHLPPQMQYIVYPRTQTEQEMQRVLPEFSKAVRISQLRAFNVYTRDENTD